MKSFDPEDKALRAIHEKRIARRDIDQLLGICEFALQDGIVDQSEAEAVLNWLYAHPASIEMWPASILFSRLRQMLSDGHLDDDEQRELVSMFMNISRPRNSDGTRASCALPLDDPEPEIQFQGKSFCFTGVFDYGTRNDCFALVEKLGGVVSKTVTKKIDYLVIGSIGSEVWRHSSFGSKIIKAVDYRDSGANLAIVSEDRWVEFVSKK